MSAAVINSCLVAAARLAALVTALRSRQLVEPDVADAIADGLDTYLRGEAGLEEALGVKTPYQAQTLHFRMRLAQRDQLVREAAGMLGGDAEGLHRALLRYSGSAWQRDRTLSNYPPKYEGKPHALLWGILKARDFVLSTKQIRVILAAERSPT